MPKETTQLQLEEFSPDKTSENVFAPTSERFHSQFSKLDDIKDQVDNENVHIEME